MFKKSSRIAIFIFVFVLCFATGCSGEQADISSRSNVTVFSDGHIEADIVEDFDKNYYSEAELLDMVKEEIRNFNLKHGGEPIKLVSETLTGSVISVMLSFENAESYNEYMPGNLFIGTIGEAAQAGYDLNRSLSTAGREVATIGRKDLEKMSSRKVVIVDDYVTLRLPAEVQYFSQEMKLLDDKTVEAGQTTDYYFVIYK